MTETATISGGNQVTLSLSAAQAQAAQSALTALSSNYVNSKVLTSTGAAAKNGVLNAYNIDATQGATYSLPAGGKTIVVYDNPNQVQASVTINAAASDIGQVLIGNNGNDTINAGGGISTIVAGDGNNSINVTTGVQSISAGTGNNVIDSTGNDTITLGAGNDTLRTLGSATVTGGSGSLYFDAREGVNSTVQAGSGSETMYGGSGVTNFYGSTTGGTDYMVGGTGTNFFEGGNGNDTMVASSSSHSEIFDFSSSVSGGNHTIDGFSLNASSGDVLQLKGYNSTDIKSITTVNSSTVIKLDDHTTITLTGVTGFNSSDIKFIN